MLRLSSSLRAELSAWIRLGYPREACGLLIGRCEQDERRVERVVHAHNLAVARDRYELDPGDLVAADHAARAVQLSIIGIWHSHPDQPAVPSDADRANAWSGWSYLIVSVTRGEIGALRAWRLEGGAFVEEAVV
ncbi:MAG: Mov34/MPN/PAD-1 family protein [Planctomycetota bacterium]